MTLKQALLIFGAVPLLAYLLGVLPFVLKYIANVSSAESNVSLGRHFIMIVFVVCLALTAGSRSPIPWLHWAANIYLLLVAVILVFPTIATATAAFINATVEHWALFLFFTAAVTLFLLTSITSIWAWRMVLKDAI